MLLRHATVVARHAPLTETALRASTAPTALPFSHRRRRPRRTPAAAAAATSAPVGSSHWGLDPEPFRSVYVHLPFCVKKAGGIEEARWAGGSPLC